MPRDPDRPAAARSTRRRRPARARGSPWPTRRRSRRSGPSGTTAPSRSRTSSGRQRPGTVHDPSAQLVSGGLRPVVLVADLADDLLDDVLEGDDARGAAVLVDDDRHLQPALRAAGSSSGSSRMVSGTITGGTISAETGTSGAPVVRHGDGLLDVDDAVDVVPVVADHGEPRVPGAAGRAGRRRRPSRCARCRSQRDRGVITSAAVRSPKPRERVSSRAVPRSRVPCLGGARGPGWPAPAGCGPPDSSSCGLMPIARRAAVGRAVEQRDQRLRDAWRTPRTGPADDLGRGERREIAEGLGHHLAERPSRTASRGPSRASVATEARPSTRERPSAASGPWSSAPIDGLGDEAERRGWSA